MMHLCKTEPLHSILQPLSVLLDCFFSHLFYLFFAPLLFLFLSLKHANNTSTAKVHECKQSSLNVQTLLLLWSLVDPGLLSAGNL